MICEGKFTEYFTPELMRDLNMKKDYKHEWNNCFQEASGKHLDAHLAECLACGGRGFLGLRCMKCKAGTYNLLIGLCEVCFSTGLQGAQCQICRSSVYQDLGIKCLNPRVGTIYNSQYKGWNAHGYNTMQERRVLTG